MLKEIKRMLVGKAENGKGFYERHGFVYAIYAEKLFETIPSRY